MRVTIISLITALLAACSPPTASPQAQVEAAVAATLASIPTATPAPIPTVRSFPSPTAFSLENTFCEYGFCVGHPQEIFLIDQGATRNPPAPSAYSFGILFSYSQNLFIQVAWRLSGPSFDPQGAMQIVMVGTEQFQGSTETKLVGSLNVFYNPITVSGQSLLPYGGIATWQCGGRDFIWKVYTPQDGMAPGLLAQALEKFRCETQ
jgi:hypothetical protein